MRAAIIGLMSTLLCSAANAEMFPLSDASGKVWAAINPEQVQYAIVTPTGLKIQFVGSEDNVLEFNNQNGNATELIAWIFKNLLETD